MGGIISIILFWLITIYVIQDHKIELLTAIIWTVLASVSGSLVGVILEATVPTMNIYLFAALIMLTHALVLFFYLRFRIYVTSIKQIAQVLGTFYVSGIVLSLIF